MRPSTVALAAVAVLAVFTVWITRQAKALEQDLDSTSQKIALQDKSAPDFHLTTLDGHPAALSDYTGKKKLVLIFFASWNNASHPELLGMSMLYQSAHKQDSDWDMLGVSLDDKAADAKQLVEAGHIAIPVVLDEKRALADAYQIRTVPTALLIENGKVTFGSVGINQRGVAGQWPQKLGVRTPDFRMEMRGPNGGRGN